MHELSIAINIVNELEQIVRNEKGVKVVSFTLKIGTLSGIVPESLDFALESAIKETLCEGSTWKIEKEEALGKCLVCFHTFPMEEIYSPCPVCGAFNPEIVAGQGLKIISIEIEE